MTGSGTPAWIIQDAQVCRRSCLSRRRLNHDLRHTAASLAVSAGANVKAVQRMLGHAKASMTLDTYADLFDHDLDAVAITLHSRYSRESAAKMWPRGVSDDRQQREK